MAKKPGAEKIYEVFSKFVDRCIISDKSLLWPGENCWTKANLEKIKTNFVDQPLEKGEYWEKIKIQFGSLNDECWKVLADAILVYLLPSRFLTAGKKYELIKQICDYKNFSLEERDKPFWEVLDQGLLRTSMRYHFKFMQLWLIFLFALEVKQEKDRFSLMNSPKKVQGILDKILESIEEKQYRAWDMRHALLHMAFPESYEHIISTSHKEQIVNTFKEVIPKKFKRKDIEEQLKQIRNHFERRDEYQDIYFNFYLPEIKAKWASGGEDEKNGDTVDPREEDPQLGELFDLLSREKQIIIYGPPGTGKTYYAIRLAKEVIAQNNFDKSSNELTEEETKKIDLGQNVGIISGGEEEETYLNFCTFHPAFGYEEFIEGYRPRPGESGSPDFILQDGIFKKLCHRAMKRPEKTYVLIIDEINRGNIPRIFGEMITVIEKDKRYIDEKNKGVGVKLPFSLEPFFVPENILIIGTMNTADRSIALLDVALSRRFGRYELMPMPGILDGVNLEGIDLGVFLRELNSRISREVGRNLQIGHSYLMEKGSPVNRAEDLVYCLKDKIIPLLQEYCYDDYSRLSRILGSDLVDEENKTFKFEVFQSGKKDRVLKIIKEFCESGYQN